jgi:predicted unusual protein kinase regulating ubiquinone biosynthesis (AarF/ABC1/UbiB family)
VTFEQFFVHGFFHADPHPGNIFVTPTKSGRASPFTLTFIDFGMMGEITDLQRKRLQSFIFAVVARDARGWISAVEDLGLLLPTADTVQLEKAITELFKRFGGVAVTQIAQTDPREIREFAARFSDLVLALPFQFPENFLMLLRSISVISGVTSALNRDFNMWDAVDPFARSLLNAARNGTLRQFGADAYETLANLARIPGRIESLATRAERGELSTRNPELEARLTKLDGSTRRLGSALVFTALLGAGVALRIADDALGTWLLVASLPALLHALGLFRLR